MAALDELPPGKTLKFQFKEEGIRREGFVARIGDTVVAYENVCRHLPLPLDYNDGRFLTPDGRYFVCQTHGAVYEPLTGLCREGPCTGARLRALDVRVEEDQVWLVQNEEER